MLLFLAGYAQAGLYPGFGLGPVETLRRTSYVTAFGFLVLAAFSFALKLPPLYSRITFVLALMLSLVLVPVARAGVSTLARRTRWWREPVVIIGTGARAARAVLSLQRATHAGYRPAVVLAGMPGAASAELHGVPVVGGLEGMAPLARDGVRVALLETGQPQDAAALDDVQQHFRRVILLREHDDLPMEGLHVRNLGSVAGIEYTNNLLVHQNRAIKRVLDLVLASVALIVFTPVILCAMILVRLLDGRPVFFHQERGGLEARRIAVPKIRTMRNDAEQQLTKHLAADPRINDEWKRRYKLRHDPRLIPGLGRMFRRFSIDELPQLWTVLIGDMSLVGPRPFPDYHVAQFSPAFRRLRQRVRPGITGLWQITVRSEGSLEEQEAYDSYYIRNWSIWLDVYILSRTLATVASGRGAY
jgi:Undecaprenyl-phosphate galactose phosphotransferase WbaP